MLINDLVNQITKLPGIGKRTAIRIAYDILSRGEQYAKNLGESLINLHARTRQCRDCYNFCESEICEICSSLDRERSILCVVESPQDLEVLESTKEYDGLFFVLHGHLDPLNNVGPSALHLDKLFEYIQAGNLQEVIVATEFSIEGDVTANYISSMLKGFNVKVTRIASGLPVGGKLGSSDKITALRSLKSRFSL